VQLALAWFGHRRTVAPAEAASKATSEAGVYLQGKLRNAEVLESMGMVHNLRPHWQERHEGCAGAAVGLAVADTPHHGLEQVHPLFAAVTGAGRGRAAGDRRAVVRGGHDCRQCADDTRLGTDRHDGRHMAQPSSGARSAFERLEALLSEYPERVIRRSNAWRPRAH
jgi:ATP-binding cassette subfamily C exporter for protease/lipase